MDENIKEIRKLLKEAYDIEVKSDDYYGKVSEGEVTVSIQYPGYWHLDEPIKYEVRVYSYVFGPHRNHYFYGKTLDEASKKALKEVKKWLKEYKDENNNNINGDDE